MSDVSGRRVRITQIKSAIARRHDQRETLIGLGLNRLHRSRELADTPAIRGMINKVKHLLKIEQIG
jgi:large subunit ribosomal protein L30